MFFFSLIYKRNKETSGKDEWKQIQNQLKKKKPVSYAAHNQVMELIASYKLSLILVVIKIQKGLVIGIDNQNNKLQ